MGPFKEIFPFLVLHGFGQRLPSKHYKKGNCMENKLQIITTISNMQLPMIWDDKGFQKNPFKM